MAQARGKAFWQFRTDSFLDTDSTFSVILKSGFAVEATHVDAAWPLIH